MLWLTAMLMVGCGYFQPISPTIQMNTAVRADGQLDFLHCDGTTITSIRIEIAETPERHASGLMGRGLADFSMGMLFVFETAEHRQFWMRKTPVPLDLIFVGEDSQVIAIVERAKPMSDRTYHSRGAAKYVVEVRAGFVERHRIQAGTRIRWQRF
jgi:uncharacterized membrane protein (UPF0127 family)